jgi:hypothetical protein
MIDLKASRELALQAYKALRETERSAQSLTAKLSPSTAKLAVGLMRKPATICHV